MPTPRRCILCREPPQDGTATCAEHAEHDGAIMSAYDAYVEARRVQDDVDMEQRRIINDTSRAQAEANVRARGRRAR